MSENTQINVSTTTEIVNVEVTETLQPVSLECFFAQGLSSETVVNVSENVLNVDLDITETQSQNVEIDFTYPTGPRGAQGPAGISLWGTISGTLSAQTDLWKYLSAVGTSNFDVPTLTNYLSTNNILLCSLNVNGQILSAGVDLFDIFLTSETDSQTLSYIPSSYLLSISNGNTVNLSSINSLFGSVSGRYDSTSTVVEFTSASWNDTSTTVQLGSSNWYSASGAAFNASKNYTHQYFVPLSGNATIQGPLTIEGDLYLLSSVYMSGSAFYVNAQDLIVSDPIIYIAEGNQTDFLDIGIIASWTNPPGYPAGYQHGGLIRRSDNKTWTLFSGASSEPLSGLNVEWSQQGIVLEPLSAKFYGDIYGNRFVYGSLSATGSVFGSNLNISNWNTAYNTATVYQTNSATYAPKVVLRSHSMFSSGDYAVQQGRNVELNFTAAAANTNITITLPRQDSNDNAQSGDELLIRLSGVGVNSTVTIRQYTFTGSSYLGTFTNLITFPAGTPSQTIRLRLGTFVWTLLPTPNLFSPTQIGLIAPNTGTFTTLSATRAITNELTVTGNISGFNTTVFFNAGSATGFRSFATNTGQATGSNSFAEGNSTRAHGSGSHAEGIGTLASGTGSHAEGNDNIASGTYAHAQGSNNEARGLISHAMGSRTRAVGDYSFAGGRRAVAKDNYSYVWATEQSPATQEISSTRVGQYMVSASGGVFIPGNIGIGTDNNLNALTVVGNISGINLRTSFNQGSAIGDYSFAEGKGTASGFYSHAEGEDTIASGETSHAEGLGTVASGNRSHAEGSFTIASGNRSHAEGRYSEANGDTSHAAGYGATAAQNFTYAWSDGELGTREPNLSTTREGQYMIDATGGVYIVKNVGIGTDSINNALTVAGNVSAFNFYGNGSNLTGINFTLSSNSVTLSTTTLNPIATLSGTNFITSRVLQDKLGEIISVKDFGARGDGVTNDWLSIQRALSAAAGIARVYIPQGLYFISQELRIPSNSYIYGAGIGTTIIKLSSTANATQCVMTNSQNTRSVATNQGNENITIKDLELDGNVSRFPGSYSPVGDTSGTGLCFAYVKNALVERVSVHDTCRHCFDIGAPETSITFNPLDYVPNPSFNIHLKDIIAYGAGDDNITTHFSHNITIENAYVPYTGGTEVATNSNGIEIDDGSYDITIIGGYIKNCRRGLEIKGHSWAPAAKRVKVYGLTVENCVRNFGIRHLGFDNTDSKTAFDVSLYDCTSIAPLSSTFTADTPRSLQISNYDGVYVKDFRVIGEHNASRAVTIQERARNVKIDGITFTQISGAITGITDALLYVDNTTQRNVTLQNLIFRDCVGLPIYITGNIPGIVIDGVDAFTTVSPGASSVVDFTWAPTTVPYTVRNVSVSGYNYAHTLGESHNFDYTLPSNVGLVENIVPSSPASANTQYTVAKFGWREGTGQSLNAGVGVRVDFTSNIFSGVSAGLDVPVAYIGTRKVNGTDSDVTSNLTFGTLSANNSTPVDRLTITSTGNVGINTTAPNNAAILQLDSTTRGFLPPRMTTAQRDTISVPPSGLMVYNTNTNLINYYTGSTWVALATAAA